MSVIKLNSSHAESTKHLFGLNRYMGVDINDPAFFNDNISINTITYDIFCSTYLSDLNNFHAYGYIEDNIVKALISFYESDEEPVWYYTVYRSLGNNNLLRPVLDAVINHNEEKNRFKFYSLIPAKYTHLQRRFQWSEYNNNRYDYIDEFVVPAKTKCFYTNHWELLFKKMLSPEDMVVRCSFLKKEFRESLPIGGNL